MNMGASLDKAPAEPDAQCPTQATSHPSTEISSLVPLPSEIATKATSETSSKVFDNLIRRSQHLEKHTNITAYEIRKEIDYMNYLRGFVKTSEERELHEQVRNQLMTIMYRSKNNFVCEKEADLSSEIRQTVDALYKRLQENLTVAEVSAEFETFNNLALKSPSAEDNESFFKAKLTLIRALKEAEAKEQAAAWASSGSKDPQPPLVMSRLLRSQIKHQILKLTMTKDREAILTLGYEAAQDQSEQRLAQARKEYETMLNGESSQDQKEVEVSSDETPATTKPQADPQVIVKYLEFKLQTTESAVSSLRVELMKESRRSQKTISNLTGELKASKNREEQLRIENEELRKKQENGPLVDQSLVKYTDELSKELATTTDILNSTQFEAVRLRMRLEKTEKLVEEMKARIECEEKENSKFKDEVVNLEVLLQTLQINNGEKAQKLSTQIKQLEKDLNTEKRQNAAVKAENEELVTCNAKLENVRKVLSGEIVELRGVCESSISCTESKIRELTLNAERVEKIHQEVEDKLLSKIEEVEGLKEENEKLAEKNEELEKSKNSDQANIDDLVSKICRMKDEYLKSQRDSHQKIEDLSEKVKQTQEVATQMNKTVLNQKSRIRETQMENQDLFEQNENFKKAYENLLVEMNQQEQLFSSKLDAAERKIDVLTKEVNVSEEKVKELKEEIEIGTEKHRKMIERNEDLERDYACFQETANSKVENLESRLRKANEALSMEQDKLKHAETTIECLRKADIELSNELKQCVLEKSESEKKLKSELKKVTESLEKSYFEAIDAAVKRQQLKDTIGLMEKQSKKLVEDYNEKSRLLAAIQKEKKEKQLEKDELEEQGYELFEF